MKHHLMHRSIFPRCLALRRGIARPARWALCASLWTAWGRLAGVLLGEGVQREHRQLEHRECFEHGQGMRPPAVARNRRPSRSSGPGCKCSRRRCGDGPPWMWASPGAGVGVSRGADVGQVWLNCERVLCTTSINATWWCVATRLCDEAPLNASFDISAMSVASTWHCTAGALGFVHCAVDGVGSACRCFTRRRRSTRTSAAGTPRVFRTCSRHAPSCRRAQPTSFSQQWSRQQVFPAQMWGWPALD
jgi:hypothetical protein